MHLFIIILQILEEYQQETLFMNQNTFYELEPKNIIVVGKTGQGKSYFLNLLLKETPNEGRFQVYDVVESGTHVCQIEQNKTVQFGSREEDVLTMNIIDTPGLFDTNDDPFIQEANQYKPDSIKHFENIEQTVIAEPFKKKISRVLLVIKVDNKFDEHVKKMIEISKILVGQQLKVCVILTKCQKEYDEEEQHGDRIIQILKQKESQWRKIFAIYGIEDVFLFGNKNVSQQQSRYPQVTDFYQQQWYELYKNLKRAALAPIKTWTDLSFIEQITIAKYFGHTLNNQSGGGCLSLNCNIDSEYEKQISVTKNNQTLNQVQQQIKGFKQSNTLLGMIHYSRNKPCQFLRIIYTYNNNQQFIELTENHLIYCASKNIYQRANLLNLNDLLLFADKENYQKVKIINIEKVIQFGFYSPLTSTGEFFSNGILLSCYVSPREFPVSQQVAHHSMLPLILYRQLSMKKDIKKNDFPKSKNLEYQAPYSKFLEWAFCQK